MSERKSWSQEEDKALKQLYQQCNMRRWAQIARAMQQQFKIKGRSGKQCRERYYNHLDTTIRAGLWSTQEEKQLMDIHSRLGNKWAQISRAIPGRSENCVKNKFYSILRKGLRLINKVIKNSLKKYNLIQIGTVFRIVQISELAFKRKKLTKEIAESLEIKKSIVNFGLNGLIISGIQPEVNLRVKKLIDRIKAFGKQNATRANKEDKRSKQDESQDVQSAEQEDKMPLLKMEKIPSAQLLSSPAMFSTQQQSPLQSAFQPQIPQPQTVRRESFQLVLPPPPEAQQRQRTQEGDYRYVVGHNLANLIAQSGDKPQQINYFDKTPRQGGILEGNWTVRSFEVPQFEYIRSPRPLGFIDSPYFDQLRCNNNLNSFNPFYPQ